ncbi:MAG: MBL fold metallo-hydrolase [Planctomycetaceae bacterium]|jgi:phosphoribosyl 1,2-cyclic phosphate phosphodiesterase|nr:MAG: MBL fold metallo-hydrolase [Planctomycetaceae bacterium]
MILMGTGTSVGVPAIGCGCDVCQSTDRRNNRTRCSAILGLPEGNLLIDTSPDLRTQLLRERIGLVHAVLYTHDHADHVFGLDDLRLFPFYIGGPVPLYCEPQVERRIRHSFDYAFSDLPETHTGSRPQLVFREIDQSPFSALGVTITPIPMRHGPRCEVLGFRIGDVAYCTDTNEIPAPSLERLRGLDTLVIDALRYTEHPTHFSVDQALEVIAEVRPRRAYLTHMAHDIDYVSAKRTLPAGVEPGFDGLRIELV